MFDMPRRQLYAKVCFEQAGLHGKARNAYPTAILHFGQDRSLYLYVYFMQNNDDGPSGTGMPPSGLSESHDRLPRVRPDANVSTM